MSVTPAEQTTFENLFSGSMGRASAVQESDLPPEINGKAAKGHISGGANKKARLYGVPVARFPDGVRIFCSTTKVTSDPPNGH